MAHDAAKNEHAQPARDHAVAICRAANAMIDAIEVASREGFQVQVRGLEYGLTGYLGAYDVQVVTMDGEAHICTAKGLAIHHREAATAEGKVA